MNSPISEPQETAVEEVSKEKKNKKSNVDDVLSSLQDIKSVMLSFSDRLDKVEHQMKEDHPVAPKEPEEKIIKSAEVGKEDALITSIKKILGRGEPERCEFEITTVPDNNGRAFRLVIIPPEHLREMPNDEQGNVMDRRVIRLMYHEGKSGAEDYAKRVADRCMNYATKNAKPYFSN